MSLLFSAYCLPGFACYPIRFKGDLSANGSSIHVSEHGRCLAKLGNRVGLSCRHLLLDVSNAGDGLPYNLAICLFVIDGPTYYPELRRLRNPSLSLSAATLYPSPTATGGRCSMSQQRLQLTWYNKDMALIPTEDGRYGYSWVDPSDPRYCETRVLELDEYVTGEQTPRQEGVTYSERADLEPQGDNLMVLGESGDVLEALTRTPELAERYVGKVKLVYIDPPFNTEKAFPSYEDNLEHSIWLTMMRDRLLNLKKLMSDDATIWVHIDDVEVHRIRMLMDEVFGAGQFLSEIAWEKTFKPRNDKKEREGFSSRHDMILVYAKSSLVQWNRLPRTVAMDSAYKNPDNDPLGPLDKRSCNSEQGRRCRRHVLRNPKSADWQDASSPSRRALAFWTKRYVGLAE